MKVQELIKELSLLNGDLEVVVGNQAINFIETLPAYYDGYYQNILMENFKIKGIEFSRTGEKVQIHLLSLSDLIGNCDSVAEIEQLEFKFTNLNSSQETNLKAKINSLKEEQIKFLQEN